MTDNQEAEMKEEELPDFPFDYWYCPVCGWIIMDKAYIDCRFDYGCPRCGCSFFRFHLHRAEESNPEITSVSYAE